MKNELLEARDRLEILKIQASVNANKISLLKDCYDEFIKLLDEDYESAIDAAELSVRVASQLKDIITSHTFVKTWHIYEIMNDCLDEEEEKIYYGNWNSEFEFYEYTDQFYIELKELLKELQDFYIEQGDKLLNRFKQDKNKYVKELDKINEQIKIFEQEYLDYLVSTAVKEINSRKDKYSRRKLISKYEVKNYIDFKFEVLEVGCGGYFESKGRNSKHKIVVNREYLNDNKLVCSFRTSKKQKQLNENIVRILIHELTHYYMFFKHCKMSFVSQIGYTINSDSSMLNMMLLAYLSNFKEENSYASYNYFKNTKLYEDLKNWSFLDIESYIIRKHVLLDELEARLIEKGITSKNKVLYRMHMSDPHEVLDDYKCVLNKQKIATIVDVFLPTMLNKITLDDVDKIAAMSEKLIREKVIA